MQGNPFQEYDGRDRPCSESSKELHQKPQHVIDALNSGARQCKAIAEEVMDEVRRKIGVKSEWVKQ